MGTSAGCDASKLSRCVQVFVVGHGCCQTKPSCCNRSVLAACHSLPSHPHGAGCIRCRQASVGCQNCAKVPHTVCSPTGLIRWGYQRLLMLHRVPKALAKHTVAGLRSVCAVWGLALCRSRKLLEGSRRPSHEEQNRILLSIPLGHLYPSPGSRDQAFWARFGVDAGQVLLLFSHFSEGFWVSEAPELGIQSGRAGQGSGAGAGVSWS